MNIAKLLKDRRLGLEISQDELAKHLGFEHRSNVHRLETGKIHWKFKDVDKACKLLDLIMKIKPIIHSD